MDGVDYMKLLACQGYAHRAAGDVHGLQVEMIPRVESAFGERFGCAVVVREPMARLASQVALFQRLSYSRGWNVDYVADFTDGRVVLPDDSYQSKLFVHGVNMLNNILRERTVAPVYRCEDLTSNAERLGGFVDQITRGRVGWDEDWARRAVGGERLNSHVTPGSAEREMDFDDWQAAVIVACVEPTAWDAYETLGYERPAMVC